MSEPAGQTAPLIFSSPHSGRLVPPGFAPAVPVEALVGYEDRFVDDLLADAPSHGIALVAATFPRAYIDPNRAIDDLGTDAVEPGWRGTLRPSANAERGIGLVFRKLQDGRAIYDHPLGHAELAARIDGYWQPFHATLAARLEETARRWGAVWHVDWHSMRPVGDALSPDPGAIRSDFVVSDRDGTSAEPAFTAHVVSVLEALGHSVAVNEPFKGGYVVESSGSPAEGRHSLQVEINRRLYLDPDTLEPSGDFHALRRDLGRVAEQVAAYVRARARP